MKVEVEKYVTRRPNLGRDAGGAMIWKTSNIAIIAAKN